MLQEHIKNLQQEIANFKVSVNKVDSKGGQKTRDMILEIGQESWNRNVCEGDAAAAYHIHKDDREKRLDTA